MQIITKSPASEQNEGFWTPERKLWTTTYCTQLGGIAPWIPKTWANVKEHSGHRVFSHQDYRSRSHVRCGANKPLGGPTIWNSWSQPRCGIPRWSVFDCLLDQCFILRFLMTKLGHWACQHRFLNPEIWLNPHLRRLKKRWIVICLTLNNQATSCQNFIFQFGCIDPL